MSLIGNIETADNVLEAGTLYQRGPKGDTPVRGVDYFTDDDIAEFEETIQTNIIEDANNDYNTNVRAKLAEFNTNATNKTNSYNSNATSKTTAFNTLAEEATSTFENNVTSKTTAFNSNATSKTSAFDSNYNSKLSSFNTNSASKTDDYNSNATSKTEAYNTNAETKLSSFNSNASSKTNDFDSNVTSQTTTFNSNATSKTTTFNSNATSKTESYNTNHTTKLAAYNSNDETKLSEYNSNHTTKLSEYNSNAATKIEEYNTNAEELIAKVNKAEKLYSIIPKSTVSRAKQISYKNAQKFELLDWKYNGNVYQLTTTGYNLFDAYTYMNATYTVSGGSITYTTNEDGEITQSATDNSAWATEQARIFELEAGTYTIMVFNLPTGITLQMRNLTDNTDVIKSSVERLQTITLSDTKKLGFKTYSSSATYPLTYKIMIVKGTEQKPYEPYTGLKSSPNPDYPQEVVALKSYNEFTYNANSQTVNGITFTVNEDKTISARGTSTDIARFTVLSSGLTLPKGKHIFTGCPSNGGNSTYKMDFKENGTYLDEKGTGVTFESNTDISITEVRILVYGGQTVDLLFKPMIVEGTEQKPYLPYNSIGIKRIGNILDNEFQVGTILSSNGNNGSSTTRIRNKNYSEVKPSTLYRIESKGNISNMMIYEYDNDKTFVKGTGWVSVNYDITTQATTKYIRLLFKNSDATMSTSDLEYSYVYDLNESSIDYINLNGNEVLTDDYVYLKNGKAYLHKAWGKVVLDGSENWSENGTTGNCYRYRMRKDINYKERLETNTLCTHFISKIDYALDTPHYYLNTNDGANTAGQYFFTNISTLADFKTWLSANKPIVYYQLETPQEIELGTTTIESINGSNNVTVLATLDSSSLSETYAVDVQSEIEELQNAILVLGS